MSCIRMPGQVKRDKVKIRTLENHKGCGTPSHFCGPSFSHRELVENLSHKSRDRP